MMPSFFGLKRSENCSCSNKNYIVNDNLPILPHTELKMYTTLRSNGRSYFTPKWEKVSHMWIWIYKWPSNSHGKVALEKVTVEAGFFAVAIAV